MTANVHLENWARRRVAICRRDAVNYTAGEVVAGAVPAALDEAISSAVNLLFFGSASHPGNPFAHIVQPGMRVLLKPNWVRDYNPLPNCDLTCLYTQGPVVRAVLRLVLEALDGSGSVVIADAPLQSCNFRRLMERSGLENLTNEFATLARGVPITIRDMRLTFWNQSEAHGASDSDFSLVDIGWMSEHASGRHDPGRYRVSCYDPRPMRLHHTEGKHEYLIANEFLDADLVINLPKLKTHKKAGLTNAMKNLVGINGHKEFLPHHAKGAVGGDEFARFSLWKWLYSNYADLHFAFMRRKGRILSAISNRALNVIRRAAVTGGDDIFEGSWPGNDTIWRTIADLNRIAYYFNRQTGFQPAPVRTILSIVDGIVAGEADGPLSPEPKYLGIVMAGTNSWCVDAAAARLCGFDWTRLPFLCRSVVNLQMPLSPADSQMQVECLVSDNGGCRRMDASQLEPTPLRPASHWETTALKSAIASGVSA